MQCTPFASSLPFFFPLLFFFSGHFYLLYIPGSVGDNLTTCIEMRSWKRNTVNWKGVDEKWEAGFQGQGLLTPRQRLLDWLCGMVWEGTLASAISYHRLQVSNSSFAGSFAGILCIPTQSKLIYQTTLNFWQIALFTSSYRLHLPGRPSTHALKVCCWYLKATSSFMMLCATVCMQL